jgi:hypothetical protein
MVPNSKHAKSTPYSQHVQGKTCEHINAKPKQQKQ